MNPHLVNVAWHTLAGAHAAYANGTRGARRYARGFTPILGFADLERPDLDALQPFCTPGELLYCDGWDGPAPSGWRIEGEVILCKMVWESSLPAEDPNRGADVVRLRPAHGAQAVELAAIAGIKPFGARAIELGEALGVFEGGELVAMAGERMRAGGLRPSAR